MDGDAHLIAIWAPVQARDRRPQTSRPALVALVLCFLALSPALSEERKNWFADPFLQLSNSLPDCPEPRGPRTTDAERRQQAHHGAERGTTCWLRGECDRPSAYDYDKDIAAAIRHRWSGAQALADSIIWVTVQGRIVNFEGCVRDVGQQKQLEAIAMSVPSVLQAIAIVRLPGERGVPYSVWNSTREPQ